MKSLLPILAVFVSLIFTGCYTGSQFTIEAKHLDQPVSLTTSMHNADAQIVDSSAYDNLGRFSMSFTGWSLGWPLSPNPRIDISRELNAMAKTKNGNGITGLSLQAANSPVNGLSMVFKGFAWICLVVGAAILVSNDQDKAGGAELVAGSAAAILFLPTVGNFTLDGTVVRVKEKPPP